MKFYKKIIKLPNFDAGLKVSARTAFLILSALVVFYGISAISLSEIIQKEYSAYLEPESKNFALERKLFSLTRGYPMEKMVPLISQKEKRVAAFMVSVAKKESNWGKRVPVLNGRDCYNYWGFRSAYSSMTQDGYTCFKNPYQAVNVVSRRFAELINESHLDTPQKMIVWKCGWDCSEHDPEGVSKWISDVDYYFRKIY
jgi:hypothetical protein